MREDRIFDGGQMQSDAENDVREFVAARTLSLYRTAFLLVGDSHEAEELTQAALVQVIDSWDKIRRRDAPEVYARRVLINLAAQRWRRLRAYRDLIGRQPRPGSTPDPAESIVVRNAMAAAVRSLPMRMRAVIVLRYYDDLSEAEVAAILGVTSGTVKSQTSKALAHLRARLEPHDLSLSLAARGPLAPDPRSNA